MAGAVIGALRVVLGADSAALVTNLDKARDHLSQFGANVAKAGAVAGAAMAAGLAVIALGVRNTLAEMDGFRKQSQKIGIPVEQLSALKHAAELSDVSMESLGKSVGKLSKAMVEAAAKPASEAADAFRALGVSVTDSSGKLRPASDMLESIAGKFEGMKDGAGKTAIAMALLGKSGADLIPLLNSGQAGLAGMIAEARQLGLVIDTQTAMAAERFRDNLTRLSAIKNGIIIQLTAHMLPALEALSQRMIDTAKNSNLVQTVSGALKTTFDLMARAVLLVADNIGVLLRVAAVFVAAEISVVVVNLGLAFVKLASAIRMTGIVMVGFNAIRSLSLRGILLIAGGIALLTGNFDALTDKLKDIGAKIEAAMPDDMGAKLKGALKDLGFNISGLEVDLTKLGNASEGAGKNLKNFNYHALGGKTALDAFFDSTKKGLAAQEADANATGLAAGAKEKLKIQLQAVAIAEANHIPMTAALTQKIFELGLQAEQTALKLQGMNLIQASLPIWQQYTMELNNNTAAMLAAGASAEQVARMGEMAAQKYGLAWSQQAASVSGSMGEIASAFAGENSKIAAAAKVFGAVQALISTYAGAAEALKLPFPFNIAASAAVLAKGLGLVAAIKGFAVPKAAMGGAFTVGGGISATDNKMVPLNLASGERVKIEPNRYGESGNNNNNAAPTTINFDMPAIVTRDTLRVIFDGFNEMFEDGYRLKAV